MKVVLISTYELGHQPFGLASPAAWLRQAGAQVACLDLAVQSVEAQAIREASLIAFYVPMHTAARLAISFLPRIRHLNPTAHLCFYGLYAPLNEAYLRRLGADSILGGEFEAHLIALYHRLNDLQENSYPQTQPEPVISLHRQIFQCPDREALPPLSKYAYLDLGLDRQHLAGYTEASRGCKHQCRHCPVVPVYQGRFRIVQPEVVLADIRQQIEAGAQHITFGDPDFFNGPRHAKFLLQALHTEWPELTYDVTIKVEHLLKHAVDLPLLKETGCLFVTSAIEAVDDAILTKLNKGHTSDDFAKVVDLFEKNGLNLNPTFVSFTPWISLSGYLDFLHRIAELGLINHVAPIQYAIRLLIPAGSYLLDLPDVQTLIKPFDEMALVYPWVHADPRVDSLQSDILALVQDREAQQISRPEIFAEIWSLALTATDGNAMTFYKPPVPTYDLAQTPIPRLSEPWYC